MKITVCIPSRNRPLGFINVLMSAWRLRSQKNEIQFATCFEQGDFGMNTATRLIDDYSDRELNLYAIQADNVVCATLGGKWNHMIDHPAIKDSDAITFLGDKTIPIAPGWDDTIAHNVQLHPQRILWWDCTSEPGMCCVPIVPHKVLAACDQPLLPSIFPFWFVDTWLEELDMLIWGLPPIILPVKTAGERGNTAHGRDFQFWCEIYAEMQPQRLTQAQGMAKKLTGTFDIAQMERTAVELSKRDKDRTARAPQFEEWFKDHGPTTAEYRALKRLAERNRIRP